MFEDYKKRQEELDNREKCAKKEYEIAQAYLFSYNDDLETTVATVKEIIEQAQQK